MNVKEALLYLLYLSAGIDARLSVLWYRNKIQEILNKISKIIVYS